MPWHVEESHDACPASRPWAVVKDADGEVEGCHATQSEAQDQVAALYANEGGGMNARIDKIRDFVKEHDDKLYRGVPFQVESVRASGDPAKKGSYAITGEAIVTDAWSLDLGGFREKIAPGAADEALRNEPHVLHTWDHDTSKVLSSTRGSKYKLDLRVNENKNLAFHSQVVPTSYANDLHELLDDGIVAEASFAFTTPDDGSGEEWTVADDGVVERTITKIQRLFDVTTCALGAYPATESALALRSLVNGRAEKRAEIPVTPVEVGEEKEVASVLGEAFSKGLEQGMGTPQTSSEDVKEVRNEPSEDREAREREFEKWRQQKLAEHRHTRELVFGVKPSEGEKQ